MGFLFKYFEKKLAISIIYFVQLGWALLQGHTWSLEVKLIPVCIKTEFLNSSTIDILYRIILRYARHIGCLAACLMSTY